MALHFLNTKESTDLDKYMLQAKEKGATSGGVFGSILEPKGRKRGSDIDIIIIDENAPIYGEIEHETGSESGVHLHIFKKRPGIPASNDRRGEILAEAEARQVKLFG